MDTMKTTNRMFEYLDSHYIVRYENLNDDDKEKVAKAYKILSGEIFNEYAINSLIYDKAYIFLEYSKMNDSYKKEIVEEYENLADKLYDDGAFNIYNVDTRIYIEAYCNVITDKMQTLQKELTEASDSYYSSGIELMSNKEYDAKFDELRVLEQQAGITDGFTAKVGAAVSGKLPKVTHQYEAKSLGKTKDIEELIAVHNGLPSQSVCLSWKCDGSTVQLTYKHGELVTAATRGDGHTGQDITKNAKYIEGIPSSIPFKADIVVRGEALMTYEEFDRLNTEGQFANPRNLANATITAIDETLLQDRKVIFKAFELVDTNDADFNKSASSFSKRLDYLNTLGFGTVMHKRVDVKDLKDEIKAWSDERAIKAIGFPVDGLVVANDNVELTKNLTGTEHHPHLAKGMAFKWQDETAETILRDIEWSPSRTGLLNPVAVFDTVDLCGTKVSRASLHNLSYAQALDLRIGDKITVYKANMIIPQIDENLDFGKQRDAEPIEHSAQCPCCKSKGVVKDNNGIKTVYCPDEMCPAKELGRLTHFVSKHGMNIEGLSEKTLEQLMDDGFVNEPADIYKLKDHRYELLQLDGFGTKAVDNLISSIEKSEGCDFSHFMYAQGIQGFGRGQIKVLKSYIDSVFGDDMNYLQALSDMYRSEFDFTSIDGIGSVLAGTLDKWIGEQLLNDTSRTNRLLEYLDLSDMTIQPINREGLDNAIAGKSFCITGSLENFANRDACVEFIEKNGGKFVSGVSKKTDYLVNNDITSTSGKNKKAKELGIPIITEKQLIEAGEGTPLPAKNKTQEMER